MTGDGKNGWSELLSSSLDAAQGYFATMQESDRAKDRAKLERENNRTKLATAAALQKTLIPIALGIGVLLVVLVLVRAFKK